MTFKQMIRFQGYRLIYIRWNESEIIINKNPRPGAKTHTDMSESHVLYRPHK